MNDRTTYFLTTLPARYPRCSAALAALVAPVPARSSRHARSGARPGALGQVRQRHVAASIVVAVVAGVVVTIVTGAGPSEPAAAQLAAIASDSDPGALAGHESGAGYLGGVLAAPLPGLGATVGFTDAALTINGRTITGGTAARQTATAQSATGLSDAQAGATDDAGSPQPPVESTTVLPDDRARVAISTAMAQLGLPYVWGGDGPTNGDAGFDCSGLTTFSYRAAGVTLPRTAHTQYYAGPRVPAGAPLHPGDLVFYGTPRFVHHVGMYLGAGRMINAPTFGKPVRTAFYRWAGDDYLGASRPAAIGQPGTLPPPAAPAPERPPNNPDVFPAPPAPLPVEPLPAPTDPAPPETDSAAAAIAAAAAAVSTPQAAVTPTPGSSTPATAAPGVPASSTGGQSVASPTTSPAVTTPGAPTSAVTAPPAGVSPSAAPTITGAPTPVPPSSGTSTPAPTTAPTTTAPSATAPPTSPAAPASSTTAPATPTRSTPTRSTPTRSSPVPRPTTAAPSTAPTITATAPPGHPSTATTAPRRSSGAVPPPPPAPIPSATAPAAAPAVATTTHPGGTPVTVGGPAVGLRSVAPGVGGSPAVPQGTPTG